MRSDDSPAAPIRRRLTLRQTTRLIEGFFPEAFPMKRTFQPSVVRRKRTHGFRARMATAAGQAILRARRRKGRARLAV